MPDYVIHIGPPKTGTTYLQRNFTSLAGAWREQGIVYPLDLGTPGHIKLARALAEPNAEAALKPVFAALNDSGARQVLLSAEDLSPLRRPSIEVLRSLIGGNKAIVVYYCRRWSDLVRSRWGERVKHGSHDTLQQQCNEALEAPLRVPAVNYGLTLRRWARVFGADALRIVCLNTLGDTQTEIATHFLQNFLHLDTVIPAPDKLQNPSMPLVETEILRALNEIDWTLHGQRGSSIRKAFIRYRDSLDLSRTAAAIEADLGEVVFDETRPFMLKVHRTVFTQYRANVVPPHLDGLFFEPRRAVFKAATGAFLHDPAVQTELQAVYAELAAMPQGRRAAA